MVRIHHGPRHCNGKTRACAYRFLPQTTEPESAWEGPALMPGSQETCLNNESRSRDVPAFGFVLTGLSGEWRLGRQTLRDPLRKAGIRIVSLFLFSPSVFSGAYRQSSGRTNMHFTHFNQNRFAAALAGVALLFAGLPAFAQESSGEGSPSCSAHGEGGFCLPETVVVANRIQKPREDVGRSVDVRSEQEISETNSSDLSDALQTVSGLRMSNVGGPGSPGTTPIEVRGFRSSGTQLLLDGMRLNDPSSVSGTAESLFAYLTTGDLQSIEVLKGANSVLYGSDGQAGALNLLSRTPERGVYADAATRGGSYHTFQEDVDVSAAVEKAGLAASMTRIDSAGITEHGDYGNSTVSANGFYRINEQLKISPILRYVDAENNLVRGPTLDADGTFHPSEDTPHDHANAQSWFYGVRAQYDATASYSSQLSVYANNTTRRFLNEFSGVDIWSRYQGTSFNIDWQNAWKVPELASEFVGGTEYEHQGIDTFDGSIDDTGAQDRYAAFVSDTVSFLDKAVVLNGGARLTHISATGRTDPSFEAAGVVRCPMVDTRLHSSVAQGFRAPTLYETHGAAIDYNTGAIIDVGNPDLREEKSLTFDAGVSQPLFGGILTPDVTFFNIDSRDTIVFDYVNETHLNGGDGQTQGIESSLSLKPRDWLLWRVAYTNLGKATGLDGERTPRRPYNIASTSVGVRYGAASFYTELLYRGPQDLAFFGTSERYREAAATVVNAAATYDITKNIAAFVRLDNLFDADYLEGGYKMPGFGAYGGIRGQIEYANLL